MRCYTHDTSDDTDDDTAGIYLFKVNNRNIRTRCEICSKLTIKTPERRQWQHVIAGLGHVYFNRAFEKLWNMSVNQL